MYRNESRHKPRGLADLLLPYGLIDDGILLQQDGSQMAGWLFHGPDLASASPSEMAALCSQLNSILRLGEGWMIQCDAIRSQAPGYPGAGAFPDPVTRLIDEERRQQFEREGVHFESEYFLTLTYLPPRESEERVRGWAFEGDKSQSNKLALQAVDRFRRTIDNFEDTFSRLFTAQRLRRKTVTDDFGFTRVFDDFLRYYRRCLTGEDHPFALPDIPWYLSDILASEDFYGGLSPRIGRKHIAVIAIDGFPKTSYPGILRELDTLEIEYRWNTRAILLDPETAWAILEKIRRKWRGKIRGWKDQFFKSSNGAVNFYAGDLAADAEAAMSLASSGDVQFAEYASNIICLDENRERLEQTVRLVSKVIQQLGFACRLEDVNAIEGWRGSLPGDGYSNIRRPILHTLNLAHMLPITSVWAGLRENPSQLMPRNSPPLLYAATSGSTPFRFWLHVSDVGHTLVIGPTGRGKSTFLGLIVAQWFRYPRARVFWFDKGYSAWALATAAGGKFFDPGGPKTKLAFCPLKHIDTDSDLQWAVSWIEVLCELNGLKFTPKRKNAAGDAMLNLRLSASRTLTDFCATIQDEEIREAIRPFTIEGPYGSLLDAEQDDLDVDSSTRLICFETEHLMQLEEKAKVPVLLYLFRRVERRLDGSPTLIALDEAWANLQYPVFASKLKEWLRTTRRKNGVVVLSTQQLSDIAKSDIADVVIEQCATQVLLPNDKAQVTGPPEHPGPRNFYERLGLSDREIAIIQTAVPKKHYYVISPHGRRLIDLSLADVALSFCAVNGDEDRAAIERLMKTHPEDWPERWLRSRKLFDWADYLSGLTKEMEEEIQCA